MPREHSRIVMTDEELSAFLASDSRLVLATLDGDGGTWADVVAYVAIDDVLYIKVPTTTRSFRNIERDARVCCVVESLPTNGSYYDIRGAIVHGPAQPLAPGHLARGALSTLEDPISPGSTADSAVYSVELGDHTSFAFSKIRYRYQDRQVTLKDA